MCIDGVGCGFGFFDRAPGISFQSIRFRKKSPAVLPSLFRTGTGRARQMRAESTSEKKAR
jgi:hypothetical protein